MAAQTLHDLPLFPLRTVLFPCGVLPLHVFELRYLEMIGRAHDDDSPFGVIHLVHGDEVQRLAPAPADAAAPAFAEVQFAEVGTLARVTHLEWPHAGLMSVRCVGVRRFRLQRRHRQANGLWRGDALLLRADPAMPVPPDLARTRDSLRGALHASGRGDDAQHSLSWVDANSWDDCGWVANTWCTLLGVDARWKQQLLEIDSPLLRLELVADLLEQLQGAPRA